METLTIAKPLDVFSFVARVRDYFDRGGVKPLHVTVEMGSGKQRTLPENSYYHGVVVQKALEHYTEKPTDLIKDVLDAVGAELTPEFVHELIKMRFRVKSTKKMDTVKFEELMTILREHFARLGKDIPEPNETIN